MNVLNHKINKHKGFTLLELMLGMGLAAGIVILSLLMFDDSNNASRVYDEVSNVGALISSANTLFATKNYSSLNNTVILKSSGFPDRMRVDGEPAIIRHQWSGSVDVTSTNFFGTPNDAINIIYNDIPESACIDFVSKMFHIVSEVQVSGTVVTNTGEAALACVGDVNIMFTAR